MYSLQLVHLISGKSIKNGLNLFYVRIVPLLKLMIPTTLMYQYWVELSSGSNLKKFLKKFKTFYLSNSF